MFLSFRRTDIDRNTYKAIKQQKRPTTEKCKQRGPEPRCTKGRQGVHQTLGEPEVLRLPRKMPAERPGAHGAPRDARAYIGPLGEPEVPRLPRKMQAETPGAHGAPRDARAYIRPLGEPEVPRLPRKMQGQRPGA